MISMSDLQDVASHWLANPWIVAYAAGVLTGINLQRRFVRWALGGKP